MVTGRSTGQAGIDATLVFKRSHGNTGLVVYRCACLYAAGTATLAVLSAFGGFIPKKRM
jgi:hypothetical protein